MSHDTVGMLLMIAIFLVVMVGFPALMAYGFWDSYVRPKDRKPWEK